ncbi:cobalamin B12-binding domain-containing protein [Sulfitobacter albidus]|uniref:Cobalamin B12-binding domain-containing protein n=1 Tax=Sulfitobacter albidus TaxID=2829501 RepID=A0A975JHJ4_9RHOB|nr:cobalamin-dependent protein [Sulfitobacter albidus]QUJ78417.1 cobalamin B12-binding domain-containing protein [Sulfitobacter albidus]
MTDRERDRSLFHDGLYRKTVTEIGTLRTKLPEDVFTSLAREVIRRLVDHPVVLSSAIAFPSDARIDELSRALLLPNPLAGKAFIARIQAQGASVETVYLAYLAEAARRLGTWWSEDKISWAEATVATGHIYAVMRGLRPLFKPTRPRGNQRAALFMPVPGENHTLGIEMAADLATKDGWDITLKRDLDHDGLVQYAAQSGHMIIGLSAAGEHSLNALAKVIVALRIRLPEASILVSGNIVRSAPDLVRLMGADATEAEFDPALQQLNTLWDLSNQQADVG